MQAGLRDTHLFAIVNDSERFVLRFFDVIEASAPHIYDSALLWSPASSLVRGLYRVQIPQEVKLFNAVEESWDACTREVQVADEQVDAIMFSHKDDLIAVANDTCVKIFEVMTGKGRGTFKSHAWYSYSWSLAFSPDDTVLVVGYTGGSMDVWDLQTGGLVKCFRVELERYRDPVTYVAFSPCGTMIASSKDYTIRIWNALSYDCQCILEGHSGNVRTICWTSTGSERVISGSVDGMVKVWDVSRVKCLKTFSGHDKVSSVMSSDDSSLIAASSNKRESYLIVGTVKVIDAETGDVIQAIPTEADVRLLSFTHHDQVMYATQSRIVIWDFRRNASVWMFKFRGHTYALTVSSDRACVASYDSSRVLKIWQADNVI